MYFIHSKKIRVIALVAALVLLIGLLASLLLENGEAAPQGGIVQNMTWRDAVLTIEGRAGPNIPVTVSLDENQETVQTDVEGRFDVKLNVAERLPARLAITLGDQNHDILVTRYQRRWLLLQRAQGELPWRPVMGYPQTPNAGLAVLVKSNDRYGLTFHIPPSAMGGSVYIYNDRRLVLTQPAAPLVTLVMPSSAHTMRLDVYSAAGQLLQRARVALPPGDASARYNLRDTDVWLFANLSAQAGEVDEQIPGQFIPVQ
ncbi:MAG: hypothetical protein AB7G06_04615 [Bdellovibrionales bacterium]